MENIQIFYVSYGGKNYTVTTQELPETLKYWREVLKNEGNEPNEGTIDLVNQLEHIQQILKKQAAAHKAQAQTHTQKPTAPTHDDYQTLLHLDGTSLALIALAVVLITTLTSKKNDSETTIIRRLAAPNGESITFYDSAADFNAKHPK